MTGQKGGGGAVRCHLIDYTPAFLDGAGRRLIISTFWLSEILRYTGSRKKDLDFWEPL
jgi:hypothetical protein